MGSERERKGGGREYDGPAFYAGNRNTEMSADDAKRQAEAQAASNAELERIMVAFEQSPATFVVPPMYEFRLRMAFPERMAAAQAKATEHKQTATVQASADRQVQQQEQGRRVDRAAQFVANVNAAVKTTVQPLVDAVAAARVQGKVKISDTEAIMTAASRGFVAAITAGVEDETLKRSLLACCNSLGRGETVDALPANFAKATTTLERVIFDKAPKAQGELFSSVPTVESISSGIGEAHKVLYSATGEKPAATATPTEAGSLPSEKRKETAAVHEQANPHAEVAAKAAQLQGTVSAGKLDAETAVGQLMSYGQAHGGITPDLMTLAERLRNAAPKSKPAEVSKQAAQATGAAPSGSAMHDGGQGHKLGEGDRVLTADNRVIAVFPTTPEGVIAAALYELHRGDKRSIDDIAQDNTGERTKRGADAAVEGHVAGKKAGTNDDAATASRIAEFHQTVGPKGKRHVETSELGPIETYIATVGVDPHAGIPWCGSFATYVYRRAGIHTPSLAFSLDVPDRLAQMAAKAEGGAYYRMTGAEAAPDKHSHWKKGKQYSGSFQEGEAGKHEKYHDKSVRSARELDIRPGDVFWQQHGAKSGHVGIIIGVHKTEAEITVVTVEGNASDQVTSKVHKITVDSKGNVTSGFKGWGRPPELGAASASADSNEKPAWIEQTEQRFSHQGGKERDR